MLINPYVFGDTDAAAYIAAVEAADGQSLEAGVRSAITAFVVGCKVDGIWDAIKASCIFGAARTRTASLTALKGAAPTLSGNPSYFRETGLKGNGSAFVDTGRSATADPQNDMHAAAYVSSTFDISNYILTSTDDAGAVLLFRRGTGNYAVTARTGTFFGDTAGSTGFIGVNRTASNASNSLIFGSAATSSLTSNPSNSANYQLFKAPNFTSNIGNNGAVAFYSIGTSLNLSLLSARVTTLINDIAAAIP